jgi:Ran GTPase-activating protein (RanGAP) involved in mRNA processing and transport
MLSPRKLVIKLLLNLGVLVEPLLEFLVCVEEELTDPAREHSETCVEVDEDLHPLEPGDDGTGRSTEINEDMLLFQLLQQLESLLLFKLRDTLLIKLPSSLLSSLTRFRK